MRGLHRRNDLLGAKGCAKAALSLGFAGVLVACGDRARSSPERSSAALEDPPGVEIVEVPGAMLDDLPRWKFSEEPVVSIGRREGEAAYLFFRVNAARMLSSGEIVVVDGQSRELRVFDQNGRFQRSFGGRGEGPGEFSGFPLSVSESDGMRVSIYDVPLRRITMLNLLSGEFTTRLAPSQCREPDETVAGSCSVTRPLPDGTIFGTRTSRPPPSSEIGEITLRPQSVRRYGVLEGEIFQVLDSIRRPIGVTIGFGDDFWSGSAIFGPEGVATVSRSALLIGDPRKYEIREWHPDGTLHRIIRVMRSPLAVTAELLERYRRWADTASNVPAVSRKYLDSLEPGGTVPFFGSMRVDREGRIWVQDYRPFWAFGPREPPAWTIFGPDGMPEARLEGGAPGVILEIGADYILVNRVGELDTEQVQLYRIEAEK